MTSYNQILSILQKIAENHQQIKGFGHGNPDVLKLEKSLDYPLLWITPENARFEGGILNLSLKLSLFDQVCNDFSNAKEVTSDLLLILSDIIAQLQLPDWNARYELDADITATPVTLSLSKGQIFDTKTCGWEATLIFKLPFSANYLAVPSSLNN